MSTVLLATLLLTPSLQTAIDGELLVNGGFTAAAEIPDTTFPLGWRNYDENGAEQRGESFDRTERRFIAIESGGKVSNRGRGGVLVTEGEKYHVVIWAKGEGTVGVSFGQKPLKFGRPGDKWKRYEKTIKALGSQTSANFFIHAVDGPIQVGFASLIPEKDWKKRPKDAKPDMP